MKRGSCTARLLVDREMDGLMAASAREKTALDIYILRPHRLVPICIFTQPSCRCLGAPI